jgi:amidase
VPGDSAEFSAGYDLMPPDEATIARLAEQLGISMSAETYATIAGRMRDSVLALRTLRDLPATSPPTRHPRLPGHRPDPSINPHNGWSWRCDIAGSPAGRLLDVTIAVKESVFVAGVPMSNGLALLEGHVPQVDATVVTRLLDQGARITGRATSEGMGLSSGSNTSVTGAVLNPANPQFSVGGSSSGCAALVAAGECDLAVGTDQGGSVRIPAALTGVYGLKPTFGLVPYTGIASIETSLDHVGFLSRSLKHLQAAFDVTAGADGMDPRQAATVPDSADPQPRRVAVLREGVEAIGDDPEALSRFEAVLTSLEKCGLSVVEVSVPEHALSAVVTIPIYAEGITGQLLNGGTSTGWKGFYPEAEIVALGRALRATPNQLPDTAKLFMLLGQYLREQHLGRYYARAQNAGLALRESYDHALEGFDALIMPTCAPSPVALPLVRSPAAADVFDASFGYHANTGIFNVTGHPALSVPSGHVRELPFGVMLVGRWGEDRALLRIAQLIASVADRGAGQ